MCFLLSGGFSCDFVEFISMQSSKIVTVHGILWDMNFKHENK